MGRDHFWQWLVLMATLALWAPPARGQRIGTWKKEVHPPLTTWQCTVAGGCTSKNTSLVLESRIRPLHVRNYWDSCKNKSDIINSTYCIDSENCYNNCAFEGVDYLDNGVQSLNSSAVKLNLIVGQRKFVNPRVYLLDETGENYEKVMLGPDTEITYDVDLSLTSCGIMTAMYLVQMEWNGGKSRYNDGGAFMGTGYCDGQCPIRDFINGEVNTNNSGSCCAELDMYEGNEGYFSMASHPCSFDRRVYACTGKECAHSANGGVCSQRFCGFSTDNATQMDDGFIGFQKTVDTSRPVTVITQMLTQRAYDLADNRTPTETNATDAPVVAMRRYFQQDGKMITLGVLGGHNTWMQVVDATCWDNGMALVGGMAATGRYLQRGTALSLSLFYGLNADSWLDNIDAYCNNNGVITDEMREAHRKTAVTYSNVRWGELGSTFKEDGSSWK